MKAALHVLRPGENVAISLIDFDGDLDRLLRPYFDGGDFNHLRVCKDDTPMDMFIASEVPRGAPINHEASRLVSEADKRPIVGVAILLEGIRFLEE
jgi:hypothetical protein